MKYIFVIFYLLTVFVLFAQDIDSLNIKTRVDSVKEDSISYRAKNIYYDANDTLLVLWGKAKINYHNSSLKSDSIRIYFTKKQASTKGISILKEGKQTLIGYDIKFDLHKKSGLIKSGQSKFDKGFYYGEEIRKIDENVYDIDDGVFTTCDAKKPHFYIKGKKVRVYFKDKVVMRPVIFYVNDFPVLPLPFGTFSLKRGRKTGILMPSPGYNKTDGKYLRNIAFFYAHKDYANFLLYGDLNEKTGWGLHLDTDYIKRYVYKGFSKIYLKKRIFSPIRSSMEWKIVARHHHDLGDKKILDADLNFISSKNILEGVDNVTDRLSKKITSQFSYKFPFLNRTFSVYSRYTYDILNQVRNVTLPSFSYSFQPKPISEIFYKRNSQNTNILSNFSFSYALKAVHYGKIVGDNPTLAEILYKVKKDTTGAFISQHNAGISNSSSFMFHKNIFGWLIFSSSFNPKFVIFDRDKNDKILQTGSSYNFNTGVKFSLYGVKKFKKFPITAVRHIITPSVSFGYHPDFRKNDRFYSFSGISVNQSDKSERMTFTLLNKWQLKIKKANSDRPKKLNDFLSIRSSFGYDATKKNDKGFSNLTHYITMRTGEFKTSLFNLNFYPNFTIYQDVYKMKLKSFDYKQWKAGINNWKFNTTFKIGFSSNANYYNYFPIEKRIWEEDKLFNKSKEGTKPFGSEIEKKLKKWKLDFSFDYNTDKNSFEKKQFTGSFRTNFNFNLTNFWHITYNNYYDLKSKKLISWDITVSRDLHCWKLVFRYTRQSGYWSYNFRIFNIKLPDALKFKTSDSKRF